MFLTENGSLGERSGGLSVSLSGPDGRVLGGGVAGLLVAASPVQVRFLYSSMYVLFTRCLKKKKCSQIYKSS